jgi:mRNA-degrading endonuclease RelE of RelBE toxin-antitoxin system
MNRRFTWTEEAKADLRGIRKEEALLILKALTRFAVKGAGDIRKLTDDPQGRYRFRVGDYRVFFRFETDDVIHVLSVENRREAYR